MAVNWKETYQVIDEDTLRLAENAPMSQPSIAATRDTTRDNNNLLGKTFQFAYQWVYKDYRYSILSPYSVLFVSDELMNAVLTYDATLNNMVTVTCPLGNSEVIGVNILAREGNAGGWFYCKKFEKEDHVDGDVFSFDFYDDSVREYIDITSAVATYHNIPKDARNIEVVNNKVVLSDCTTGYDPIPVSYDLSVGYSPGSVSSTTTVEAVITLTPSGNNHHSSLSISLLLVPVVKNQTVVFNIRWAGDLAYYTGSWPNEYTEKHHYELLCSRSYYATSDLDAASFLPIALDIISNGLTLTREVKVLFDGYNHASDTAVESPRLFLKSVVGLGGPPVNILISSYLTGVVPSGGSVGLSFTAPTGFGRITQTLEQGFQNTFKKYSSYNVGVAYYDKVGRTSGVLTGLGKSIYIPGAIAGTPVTYETRASYIQATLHHSPPSWAYYYRMCVSQSISFIDTYSTHSNSNCWEFELDGRTALALDIYTQSYAYLQGDLLIKETTTGVVTKPILGSMALITIVDPNDPTKTIDKSGNFIIIPKGSSTVINNQGTPTDGNYSQCELAIHRPRSAQEDIVYFEDTNTYSVVDGAHSSNIVQIKCGDAWIKSRTYIYTPDATKSPYSFTGEEFDINTELGIRSYSKGRPMVSLRDFGEKTQPITMWGGNYFRDTKTNEISAFNFEDTMMLDAQHGPINQMWLVGDVMKFLQTRKETSVYVGKNTFTDAGGNVSLAQVNSLFGNKNESNTDYGLNFKQASARSERLMFYWDQDKGAVVQSSPNGLLEISRYGMQSYFRNKKREIDTVLSDPTAFDVVFGYDVHHGELIALFRVGSSVDAVVFNPEENQWKEVMDLSKTISQILYHPDVFMTLGASLNVTLGGLLYQHSTSEDAAGETNVIYDEIKPITITGVLNENPLIEKELRSMSLDFDGSAYVEATTPPSSTCTGGQYTYINPESLILKSGRRHSAFLRNIKGRDGNMDSLLFSGNKMKGRWAELTVKASYPTGFEFRDMAVNWLAV